MYICCAFVGLDNKLYKMHGTYIKILKNTNLHHNERKKLSCQQKPSEALLPSYSILKIKGNAQSVHFELQSGALDV